MTNNESKAKKTKLNETLDLGIIDTQYHLHCPSPSQFGEADINHNIKVFYFFYLMNIYRDIAVGNWSFYNMFNPGPPPL